MKKKAFIFLLILLFNNEYINAKNYTPDIDESPLSVHIEAINKSYNVNFIYSNDNMKFYAPISDLFNVFNIENIYLPNENKVIGFYPFTKEKYILDFKQNTFKVLDKKGFFKEDDIIFFKNKVYIKSETLSRLFNLNLIINFSNLTLFAKNGDVLPVVKNFYLEQKLKSFKINKKQNENIKFDYLIDTTPKYFETGKLFFQSETKYSKYNKELNEYHSLNLGLGLLKGDFNLIGNGNSKEEIFNINSLGFTYYYPHNKFFRKIFFGEHNVSSDEGREFSLEVTNNLNYERGLFNTLNISKYTYPNSFIDIYINESLFKSIKSDNNGFFQIEIPINYGRNFIKIKINGPHGEKEEYESIYNIQNNLLKKGTYLFNFKHRFDFEDFFLNYKILYGYNRYLTFISAIDYSYYNELSDYRTLVGFYFNFSKSYNYTFLFDNDRITNSIQYLSKTFSILASLNENIYIDDTTFKCDFTKRLFNNIYRFNSVFYIDDNKNEYSTSFSNNFFSLRYSFNYRYIHFLKREERYLNDFLFNFVVFKNLDYFNSSLSTDYSFLFGLKQLNINLSKKIYNLDNFFKYSINYIDNLYTYSYLISSKYFRFFDLSFNTKYSINNDTNIKDLSFSFLLKTVIGYNQTINHFFINSWNKLGKATVSVIPYLDKDNSHTYSANDEFLEKTVIMVNNNRLDLKYGNFYNSYNLKNYDNNFLFLRKFNAGDTFYIPKYNTIKLVPRPNIYYTVYVPYSKTTSLDVTILDENEEPISGIEVFFENMNDKHEKISYISDDDGEVYAPELDFISKYSVYLNKKQLINLGLKPDIKNYFVDLSNKNHKNLLIFKLSRSKQ